MQLYHRGIRRRLAPMLGNDRRRLELAFSLLFALPGTPMLQYGDEIGIGDDLSLPERQCARTPMQWNQDRHGGFSRADEVVSPVIDDAEYGYQRLNVADQRRDPGSLLNWTTKMIRGRRECPEISWGEVALLETRCDEVLALQYTWRQTQLVVLHNFASETRTAQLHLGKPGDLLADVFIHDNRQASDGTHEIVLDPYGYRWFRVGDDDNALNRSLV